MTRRKVNEKFDEESDFYCPICGAEVWGEDCDCEPYLMLKNSIKAEGK